MLTWTVRLIDSDHCATLLPDLFTGSPADALAHGRHCLAHHRDCEHLQLESETFDPSFKFEISDLKLPAPTSFGGASSAEPAFSHLPTFSLSHLPEPPPLTFDLTQRKTRDGWTLINHKVLAYPMWYRHWRDAISYAAFSARGSEIIIRISDANSVRRKLVLVLPATGSYSDGLRFPAVGIIDDRQIPEDLVRF